MVLKCRVSILRRYPWDTLSEFVKLRCSQSLVTVRFFCTSLRFLLCLYDIHVCWNSSTKELSGAADGPPRERRRGGLCESTKYGEEFHVFLSSATHILETKKSTSFVSLPKKSKNEAELVPLLVQTSPGCGGSGDPGPMKLWVPWSRGHLRIMAPYRRRPEMCHDWSSTLDFLEENRKHLFAIVC